MKFVIEVVRTRDDGRVKVLHRFTADEINPKRIKVRADQLLNLWRNRGAASCEGPKRSGRRALHKSVAAAVARDEP